MYFKSAFTMAALSFLCGLPLHADIKVSQREWNLGAVDSGSVPAHQITVINLGTRVVNVSMIPTCDCFYAQPREFSLMNGEQKQVTLFFNPEEEQGEVEKLLLMESSDEPGRRTAIKLHATVNRAAETGPKAAAPDEHNAKNHMSGTPSDEESAATAGTVESVPAPNVSRASATLPVTLYYSFGCKTCERLLRDFFPELEQRLGVSFMIRKKNILNPEIMRECLAVLGENKVSLREFPALVMGDTILQGEGEIRAQLEPRVRNILDHPKLPAGIQAAPETAGKGMLPKLLFFPVLAAGLVDGINPCAFSTLIFLIVSLAYVGKHKRAIFYTGMFFTVAVFITYFLIGLGFFYVLRATTFAPAVSLIIKYVLIILLMVFAGLSVYDVILIKRGRAKDMKLQLPKGLKKRIHKSVRAYASSVALISGALVLGFMVSVFELACTGQVYFPVIAALIQTGSDKTAYFFLALYNIGFIVPLAGVFGLIYAGVNSQRITMVFQKNMALVKITLAGVFMMLAGIMVFTDFF